MANWRWYISAKAVREYMAIAGMHPADDGPDFDRAEEALGKTSLEARLCKSTESGTEIWLARVPLPRAGGRGGTTRLDLYVRPSPRGEGSKPQLVRVRAKDKRRR